MPNSPLKICAKAGCQGLWDGTSCTRCDRGTKKTNWPENRGSSSQRGYDARWRRLRARKLRADPICAECLKDGDRVTEATHVDHIVPFKGKNDPLRLDYSNLQSLCARWTKRLRRGRGGAVENGCCWLAFLT